MSQSAQAFEQVRDQIERSTQLSLDAEGWAILQGIWGQTMGAYLDEVEATKPTAWSDNRRLRYFSRKWAIFVALEIQENASNDPPSAAEVDTACRRALRLAHSECERILEQGGTPVDAGALAEFGPFCTNLTV